MIAEDGQAMLDRLADIGSFDHTGWASEFQAVEDVTLVCPGVWVQPAEATRTSEAGNGQHIKVTRSWVVVVTVSGNGQTPLENEASALVGAVRDALSGMKIGDVPPLRRLHYASEPEPFYAHGYIELPVEFELTETFTGDES